MSKQIEIYTTDYCPFCHRAIALLESKGLAYTQIKIDGDPAKRQEMLDRSAGRTTVPEVFIDGELIGGCDDLFAYDAKGLL